MANTQVVSAHTVDGNSIQIPVEDSVDYCPVCSVSAKPLSIGHAVSTGPKGSENKAWSLYQCPSRRCQSAFVAERQQEADKTGRLIFRAKKYFPTNFEPRIFPQHIDEISKEFCVIYNEAKQAEELGLTRIMGPGYRKALEFLIKDYSVKNFPESKGIIPKLTLANCIENHIGDVLIKQCAKRATWLGNDETHYERKWILKDINDLKSLIHLTVNFIESEAIANEYLHEMPDKK